MKDTVRGALRSLLKPPPTTKIERRQISEASLPRITGTWLLPGLFPICLGGRVRSASGKAGIEEDKLMEIALEAGSGRSNHG